MRVRQLLVKGLFAFFDHAVPLNLDDHITIIHGANGLGKTALLRLLNGFFNAKFSELETIPFSDFKLEFNDGSKLNIQKSTSKTKSKTNSQRNPGGLTFSYYPRQGKIEEYHFDSERGLKDRGRLEAAIPHIVPGLERSRTNEWRYLPTGEILSFYDVVTRFQDALVPFHGVFGGEFASQPEWLTKLRNTIDVHFIESQRLVAFNKGRSLQGKLISEAEHSVITPSVQVYAEEITRAIRNTLTEYAELSQSLDRTFPQRLMQQNQRQSLTSDELRDKLLGLERKRKELQAAGLLEEEQSAGFEMPENLEGTTQQVLSVYVEDVERKLGLFDTLANKIDLLKQIVDDHFLYKRMVMHREKGFLFTSQSGQPLSPTQLSSGEQHQLVLLYELLFKVKPGSLILIDEPEISLHVAWQQQFLKDLQQIIRLSRFDVLIATHSPQVIHDRWDLTVELEGPVSSK